MPVTTPEGAIVSRLTADAGVAAIVNGRIYPITDPTPYVRPKLYYQRINTLGSYCNDGPTDLRQAKLYMYASADDLATAKSLATAVRTSLDGFTGAIDGLSIGCIRITDEDDETTPLDPGTTKPPQRVRLEITIDFYA